MKKLFPFIAVLLSIGLILSACSSQTPTKSTVNIPNVQSGNNPTATVNSGAYPPPSSPASTPTIAPANTVGQSAYPMQTSAALKITKPDGTSVDLDSARLNNMPATTVKIGSNSVNGFAVLDLLASVGVMDFKQVTISSSSGSQVLTKDKINTKVILEISQDQSLQLVSPDLPESSWLKAVNAIKVE